MDAPWWEMVSRLITAVTATGASLTLLWVSRYIQHIPVRWLYWYLTAVVVFIGVWRWYIVWVGIQHDVDGIYATEIEPLIRVVGQVQLDLLLFAIGLIAAFHAWAIIRRDPPQ